MATPSTNLAKAIGIHSIAGAIIFAVLYTPLFGFYALQCLKGRTRVLFVLTLFCAIRVAAFVIRAVLAGIESAGKDLGLLTADEILLGVGFFGLLYPAYTLVLDREELLGIPPSQNIISRLMRNRRIFRLVLLAGVVIGIVGSTYTSPDKISTGTALRRAGTIIFLILTVLQAFQTCVLIRMELSDSSRYRRDNESFGLKHGIYILMVISICLLIREVYSTASIGTLSKPTNEKLWYPLFALPELLAAILYATPGLLPTAGPVDTELQNKHVQSLQAV